MDITWTLVFSQAFDMNYMRIEKTLYYGSITVFSRIFAVNETGTNGTLDCSRYI